MQKLRPAARPSFNVPDRCLLRRLLFAQSVDKKKQKQRRSATVVRRGQTKKLGFGKTPRGLPVSMNNKMTESDIA